MKELKKQWKNGEFKTCYLFYGTETFLVQNYEKALMESILPAGAELMNLEVLEEKRATAEKIMESAETFPFLNDKRLIVVKRSGFFQKGSAKEEGEKLLAYMETLPDTACILFVEEKVEKNNRLYKKVSSIGQVVEFKTPTEKELTAWIARECKQGGLSITASVIAQFLQRVESNMEAMSQEIGKLIAYKNGASEIRVEDVLEVCTPSLESKVFDLVKAVAEAKPKQAITIYKNMLLQKQSPYMILSLVTRQFRLILETALLSNEGLPNAMIAEKLEIREFQMKEYQKQSRRFSVEQWQKALSDCLEADLQIKNGLMGEEVAVEMLIMKYSAGLLG
ncbi:DNA polymerase III subunit delta [Chakrabartyella piscis]|uniref:DNA polymerase III subunit delta n=1 Tax=Chakrabartyella piscis TaxID=2918914 RepID=UPI002958C197|nr:DNA polymerase III subunit delta [Chakrabartyella piscis]